MFRAFSFALALVLCTSVWSTVYAAGAIPTFGPAPKPAPFFVTALPREPAWAKYKPWAARAAVGLSIASGVIEAAAKLYTYCHHWEPCDDVVTPTIVRLGIRPDDK